MPNPRFSKGSGAALNPCGNPIQLSVVETLGQGGEEHFLPGLQP